MTYIGLTYHTNTASTNEENLVNDILHFIGIVAGSLTLFIRCSYDGCQIAEIRFWKKQMKWMSDFRKEEIIEIP